MPSQYDWMNYLRRANIFSGGVPQVQQPFTPPVFGGGVQDRSFRPPNIMDDEEENSPEMKRTMEEYRQLMAAPMGPSQQKYRDFIDKEEPDKKNFKPTKTQRLASILTGVSEGMRKGAGAGYATATDILDRPYNEAVDKYKLQASKLAEGASLEEKNYNNKVKTLRDILKDESDRRTAERLNKKTDWDIKNIKSQIDERDGGLKPEEGWTWTTDDATGEQIARRINPRVPGGIEEIRGSKVNQTPKEKQNFDVETAGRIGNNTLGRQKNLFNYERPLRTQDQIDKEERDRKADADKVTTATNEGRTRLNENPTRQFQQRSMALQQIREERPELARFITVDPATSMLTSRNKTVLDLLKAKMNSVRLPMVGSTTPAAPRTDGNEGKVKMRNPDDNKEYWVDQKDVAEAESRGKWTIVK